MTLRSEVNIRGSRGLRANPSAVAQLIGQRFRLACRKYGLNISRHELNTSAFKTPLENPPQLELF